MSDIRKTHAYIVKEALCDVTSHPEVLGEIISKFARALRQAHIAPGAAEISKEGDEFVSVHFRTAAEKKRFENALKSTQKPCALLPAPSPRATAKVDFNASDYVVVYTVGIISGMDPSGDKAHLIETCKKAGYEDFRVLFADNEVSVHLPKHESRALFYATHERLTEEKEKAGIEIRTARSAPTAGLRVVQ